MRSLAENAKRVRAALLAAVDDIGPAEIALSGGIDSASVLAASLALGRQPACFTFRLLPGDSLDLKVARSMCEAFGLTLNVQDIERSTKVLRRDLEWVVPYAATYMSRAYNTAGPKIVKVPIQCLHAMSYVASIARSRGVRTMLTGFCADGYYGSSRAMNVMLQREGLRAWDDYRRKYLVHPTNADLLVQHYFSDRCEIELIDAWAHPAVQKVMLDMVPAELHRPFVKAVAVHAFPEFWSKGAWVRENQSLQVVGGIREWHDTLLSEPEFEGAPSILAVYSSFMGGDRGRTRKAGVRGPQAVDV